MIKNRSEIIIGEIHPVVLIMMLMLLTHFICDLGYVHSIVIEVR